MKAYLKKSLLLALVIVAIAGGYIAFSLYRKAKSSEKIKLGEVSLSSENKIEKISDIVDVLKSGLKLKGSVLLRNFSNTDFTINQLSLDCLSPGKEEKVIASQTNIMEDNFILHKRAAGSIPLRYTVDVMKVLDLFKESEVIPEGVSLWQLIKNIGQYYESIDLKKLKVRIKGFIQAEGITIDVDQIIPLYE